MQSGRRDTGGQYSVFETITRPGMGTPLHVHHREEETFYVLKGEYEFHVGAETIRATPGTLLIGPRDVPHWFRNVGTDSGQSANRRASGGHRELLR